MVIKWCPSNFEARVGPIQLHRHMNGFQIGRQVLQMRVASWCHDDATPSQRDIAGSLTREQDGSDLLTELVREVDAVRNDSVDVDHGRIQAGWTNQRTLFTDFAADGGVVAATVGV